MKTIAAILTGMFILTWGTIAASAGELPSVVIVLGDGAASEYTEKAVLRDPKVVKMLAEDFNSRTYRAERLDLRYYAIRSLPTVLIFSGKGQPYRHEGSFRSPGEFIAFALAAKRATPRLIELADVPRRDQPANTEANDFAGE